MAQLVEGILLAVTVAIFARAILSFIVPFVGPRPHPLLVTLNNLVVQITEPLLGPIRRVLPSFGGLDFSPMVVIIILIVIRQAIGGAL